MKALFDPDTHRSVESKLHISRPMNPTSRVPFFRGPFQQGNGAWRGPLLYTIYIGHSNPAETTRSSLASIKHQD